MDPAPFGPEADGSEDGKEGVKVWHETLNHVGDTWAVEALLRRRVDAAKHLRHVDGVTTTTTAPVLRGRHKNNSAAPCGRHSSSDAPRGWHDKDYVVIVDVEVGGHGVDR